MKIGLDCRLYSPKFTGIGRYVFELVKHLSEYDQENNYIAFFNDPEFDSFQLPNERWKKVLIDIPHYSFREQLTLSKKLKPYHFDLMYFPHFNVPIGYTDPFVVTIHDLTLHYFPFKEYSPKRSLKKQLQVKAYRYIMGKTLQHARHIIAVSENTKRDILKEYALPSQKISAILEGVPENFRPVDLKNAQEVKKKFQIYKPYVLYTGVWRSHKNLLRLFEAFLLLLQDGRDIQMVITGKIDPAYPEMSNFIEEHQLKDRVRLTGFVTEEELCALNTSAEVFVFPSLYEGFGLPPLEAMKFGVPVACSDRASLPEICGDAALYFDPENISDMTAAIASLLDDKLLRKQMIDRGFLNLQRFSWGAMTGRILDIFNYVCDNGSQTRKVPHATLP